MNTPIPKSPIATTSTTGITGNVAPSLRSQLQYVRYSNHSTREPEYTRTSQLHSRFSYEDIEEEDQRSQEREKARRVLQPSRLSTTSHNNNERQNYPNLPYRKVPVDSNRSNEVWELSDLSDLSDDKVPIHNSSLFPSHRRESIRRQSRISAMNLHAHQHQWDVDPTDDIDEVAAQSYQNMIYKFLKSLYNKLMRAIRKMTQDAVNSTRNLASNILWKTIGFLHSLLTVPLRFLTEIVSSAIEWVIHQIHSKIGVIVLGIILILVARPSLMQLHSVLKNGRNPYDNRNSTHNNYMEHGFLDEKKKILVDPTLVKEEMLPISHDTKNGETSFHRDGESNHVKGITVDDVKAAVNEQLSHFFDDKDTWDALVNKKYASGNLTDKLDQIIERLQRVEGTQYQNENRWVYKNGTNFSSEAIYCNYTNQYTPNEFNTSNVGLEMKAIKVINKKVRKVEKEIESLKNKTTKSNSKTEPLMINMALYEYGGRIVTYRSEFFFPLSFYNRVFYSESRQYTSKTFVALNGVQNALFIKQYIESRLQHLRYADNLLKNPDSLDECWMFEGCQGKVTVKFIHKIPIRKVSLKSLSEILPTNRNSMPQHIGFWGLQLESQNNTVRDTFLGNYTFEQQQATIPQTFQLPQTEIPFDAMTLQIYNNYGNERYTTLCRLAVYTEAQSETINPGYI